MKFRNIKTLEHFLKEYPIPVGQQKMGTSIANKNTNVNLGQNTSVKPKLMPAKDLGKGDFVFDKTTKKLNQVVSPVGAGDLPDALVTQNDKKEYQVIKQTDNVDAVINPDKDNNSDIQTLDDPKQSFIQKQKGNFNKGADFAKRLMSSKDNEEQTEGKLSNIAKRKGKKLKVKDFKSKVKKLSRKRLKEAPAELFEINFNNKEIAQEALDMPVRCGFEAESFFYGVSGSSGYDIDDMSVSDFEYEYGDLPDSCYEYYEDWLREKASEDYLQGYIDTWIEENRDEDEFIRDFMDSGFGPSEDAVEEYKEQMKEDDPAEYENREEDGWDNDNWARDFINKEYETEYMNFLEDIAREDDQVFDDALEEARSDNSMDEYVSDQYYSLSSFLDDFGVEYTREGNLEGVADQLNNWIQSSSQFNDYPEIGDYGDTNTTTGYAVENDGSVEADVGKGAELISPVFDSPREMLKEIKSLFDWSEDNFGTNSTTGFHITMSWHGEPRAGSDENGPNKLKMCLLLGDIYLLKIFNRLHNQYTRPQSEAILKQAEKVKNGDMASFLKLQSALESGVSTEKMRSIHFKSQKDSKSGSDLIEFRIMGNTDYNKMYEDVVKAVIRYATIMKAGYDDNAFKKDYAHAIYRLIKKSKEIDPKELERYDLESPILQSAKNIAGKSDLTVILHNFDVSVINLREYEQLSQPDADKRWKQQIADYEKGTGDKVEIEEAPLEPAEPITGYVVPSATAPSRRAPGVLQKAQKSFARGLNLLAQNIAKGESRAEPRAKDIGNFRKYISELSLDENTLEKLLRRDVRDDDFGPDKDAVTLQLVKKGIAKLLKKDIIKVPDFFKHQDLEKVVDGMWQFFQSDDSKDNTIIDKLADIFIETNPRLKNRKPEVHRTIVQLKQNRQKNSLFRYIKDAGYGADVTLITPNMMSDSKAVSKLMKFLEPYKGYEHPTSRDHHINIRSDDDYGSVFQYSLVQKLRNRLNYLRDIKDTDPEKYADIKERLLNIGDEFIKGLKSEDEYFSTLDVSDGYRFLGVGDLDRWNSYSDRLIKVRQDKDETTYNFAQAYDDYVLGSINFYKYYQTKNDEAYRKLFKDKFIKSLIKKRFKVLKDFLSSYDKIFQEEGFSNIKSEIADKDQLVKRNKDFEKNVRLNAKASLNIPSHSYVYLQREFFDNITDMAGFLNYNLDEFGKNLNNGGKVYVIPAAHFGQAEDAQSGLELIDSMEAVNNYYHSWRKTGYIKILNAFYDKYDITYDELVHDNSNKYFHAGGDTFEQLKKLGIEITRKGDSRAGMPGQSDLVDKDSLRNPTSDEPIDRGSAGMWNQEDDKEKEQKRFDAFDWSVYPEEMKGLVAKELKGMKDEEGYYSFKGALEKILKRVLDGDTGINLTNAKGMAKAAGVEDMDSYNSSSRQVANKTNWGNLADYLKIERGVNDQGVELLKKVYNSFDGNHNWRPENPEAIGIERWTAAVKAAYEYIQKNYTVSGGNYFRKDADGNAGDDVGKVYGTSDDEGRVDYDKARENFRLFNVMMQQGMQNYLPRGEVNKLVAFLNNPQQDNNFKIEVLSIIRRDGPFDNFMGAVNAAKEISQESIFTKFDKLPLAEQLLLIEESEVLEKWSKKYKDSINCSNPKGFSQKAHCAGKKKKKIKENLSNISEGPASDALPDNSIPYLLNKLLAEPMPAGDLRKQMDAYWAIPVPQMLSDFRSRRAEGGDEVCLRPILRNYIQTKVDPQIKKHIKLKEGKEEVIQKIEDLPDDDSQTDKIVQYIDSLLDDMGVGGRLKSIMSNLDDIDDKEVKRNQLKIAKMIASLEMTNLERAQLLAKWKKDEIVDTDKILSGGRYEFLDVFRGYGKEEYITEFVDDLSDVIGQGIGAGEFLLATLSAKIQGIGSGAGKGDLVIDGKHVELKTKSERNARFKDYHVQPDSTWSGKVQGFKIDFADIEEVAMASTTGLNSANLISMLQNPKIANDTARKKKALRSIMGIFKATNPAISTQQITELGKLLLAGDDVRFKQVYGAYNILNYLNIKRSEGDLEGILFMNKQTKTMHFVKTLEELQELTLEVGTIYPVSSNTIYPYPQIGVK